MLKAAVLGLLFFCLCSAGYVAPRIYEQDDLGDPMFDEFVYSISVDCTAATIKLIVMDEEYEPVQDTSTYLKYVDFSSPLLSTVKTDKDGFALHKLPGQTTLMRGLFILVMEKKGFRSKEVHFDIAPCYSDYTFPSPPVQEEPAQEASTPPENGTVIDVPDENEAPAETPPVNVSEEEDEEETAPAVCPLTSALLLMLLKTIKP